MNIFCISLVYKGLEREVLERNHLHVNEHSEGEESCESDNPDSEVDIQWLKLVVDNKCNKDR